MRATEASPRRLLGISAVWMASGFTAAIPYSLLPAATILVAAGTLAVTRINRVR